MGRARRNLRQSEEKISCEVVPPWFKQLTELDEPFRKNAVAQALARIKESKPDAYKFITENRCELVGFIPNVVYTMPHDEEDNLDVKYLHDFSQYTLLYWCKQAGFGFFINASLKYNAGGLRGFTY